MAKSRNERHLEKRNGIYYFRIRYGNGKTFKRSLKTADRKTAQDLRDIYLTNLAEYGQLDPPAEPVQETPTFGEVAKVWADIHRTVVRHSTWRDYVSAMNKHVLPYFKDFLITDISYHDVVKFRSQLKVGSTRANNIIVPMKSVFDFAHRQDIVRENVMRKIKRLPQEDPEINPFNYDEVNRLLDAIDPWYRPYTCVAFFTGMREGELNGLAWRDFLEDMEPEPQIYIRRSYVYSQESAPKTKKSKRYIKCLPQVLDAMAEQKKLTGNGKYVFLTKRGSRMNPDHYRNVIWTRAIEKAGLEYRPPLQMRHSFATMMLSAREDPGWVQNMMGHASLQMIFQRYYAWIPRETRSDGQAFLRSTEKDDAREAINRAQKMVLGSETDEVCPKIVPLASYRMKKGLG